MPRDKKIPLSVLARYFRVPTQGIAVDYLGREVLLSSRITNISNSGVFIRTKSPLPVGTDLEISFRLPTADIAILAAGIVRWSTAANPEGYGPRQQGMGLEFTEVSRGGQRAVERYIKEFLEKMRS